MALTKDQLMAAARAARDPASGRAVAELGTVEWAAVCDGYASVKVALAPHDDALARALAVRIDRAISGAAMAGGESLAQLIVEFVDHAGTVRVTQRFGQSPASRASASPPPQAQPADPGPSGHRPIPLDRSPGASSAPVAQHIIAVGAGKGGVGKSTVAVNLAVGLALQGHAVGLLDGDIYGPSLPTMLGLDAMEQQVLQGKLQPFLVHGIKAVTIGKLVEPDKPLIWRGPMAHGAFKQLAEQTQWGMLDFLIIDLPPGTGDVSLTMAQTLRLTGAVIVCTPQRVAQDDASRAVRMFQQLGIDVLGVVENMSVFIADDGKAYDLFGRGGAQVMAQRLGVPFLGEIPITPSLRIASDTGKPLENFAASGPLAEALRAMVRATQAQATLAAMRAGAAAPTLTIS